jgi:hypothetical protein
MQFADCARTAVFRPLAMPYSLPDNVSTFGRVDGRHLELTAIIFASAPAQSLARELTVVTAKGSRPFVIAMA